MTLGDYYVNNYNRESRRKLTQLFNNDINDEDDNIINENDIYHELLNNDDKVGDTYPDIIFAEDLFILGDFKYFVTYEEFGDLEFGHFGLMTGFMHKYNKILQEYENNNHQMSIVEGYYDKNTIAFINDNKNKTIWTTDKDDNDLFNMDHLFKPATLADKEKAADIIAQKLNVEKVYALYVPDNNHMKRLAKLLKKKEITANYGDPANNYIGDFFTIDNGSMTNFSNYMYQTPMGLLFPDFQNNYINRKDRIYGPNIDRTWKFIEPIDNAEWLMKK